MRTLIVASLIFLFIAVGGVVGYLYFVAEPKRHPDEPATSAQPETSKPVDKDQQVPLPDAAPSQPSQPEIQQEISEPEPESSTRQEQSVPEPPLDESKTSEPMRITSDIVQPVLIHKVEPEYPEFAKKVRVKGILILEAIITQKGNVESVKVLRGVHPLLDQAAVTAVKQWRYKPASLNGKPVKVYSTITVNFILK
jgi:TonB family protein